MRLRVTMDTMRRRTFLATMFATAAYAQFPRIPGITAPRNGGNNTANGLSDAEVGSGLKEALSVGTERAVKQVARPGGYLDDAVIKILLPQNLRPVERVLRTAGQGARIDDFIASMNHAAEAAAPEAAKVFGEAIRSMTIDDARLLLAGGDTSITDFFKRKTSAELTVAFRPHVEEAMHTNGVSRQYNELMGQMPRIPFMKQQTFDINSYVVTKALDGLFYVLAQQEKEIRTNPVARTTALLKAVFAR